MKIELKEIKNFDSSLIPAIIVDIDGTLSKRAACRGPFDYNLVGLDNPHLDIFELVNLYHNAGYIILVLSGREDVLDCRKDTEKWLKEHGLNWHFLFMRSEGDYRKDALVKCDIYINDIEPYYNIRAVIDDRQQVVDMWRSLGLRVLQVAPGDF